MTDLRLDGEVAVITGAGGNPGLGRSYALLLASRGAKVVVNDLGVGPDGRNRRAASAELVVQEILAQGGEAIADQHSVAEEDSARAVVQTALDAWGKVDILVNNAGVAILAEFDEISAADIEKVLRVHLFGTIWMCRAAWPHMVESGGGRIINITSGALAGNRYVSIYGAAKGGIVSLTRALAIEGADVGIKANAVGPAGETGALQLLSNMQNPPPELVAPLIAVLAHPDCSASGRYFESAAGRTVLRCWSESRGYINPELTPEDLRDHLDEVMDMTDHVLVADPLENEYSNIIDRKPYQPA